MSPAMPASIASARDALLAHLNGKGPLPPDIVELCDWYFWNRTDPIADEPVMFADLDALPLDDEVARYELDLPDDANLSDEDRLRAARSYMERIDETQAVFPYDYALETGRGGNQRFCILSRMAGQGGPEQEWIGVFPDREAFEAALRAKGYFAPDDEASRAELEAAILFRWERG